MKNDFEETLRYAYKDTDTKKKNHYIGNIIHIYSAQMLDTMDV